MNVTSENSSTPIISEIEFVPINPKKGHIGFVSFLYDGRIQLRDIAVYTRLNRNEGDLLYRLVYPHNEARNKAVFYPTDPDTRRLVECEVNSYIENVMKK